MPIFVNAKPLYQGADFAIWHGEDIPPGVMRGRLWQCAADAFADAGIIAGGHNDTLPQTATDVEVSRKYGWVAAVALTQMRRAIGEAPGFSYGPDQWLEAPLASRALFKMPARTSKDIIHEIYNKSLKHGPKQTGARGPCEPDCQKCILERELFAVTGPAQSRQQAYAASNQVGDELLAAGMSAAFEERRPRPSDEARAAWSRELRRLVAASEERERNRVLVDLECESWE